MVTRNDCIRHFQVLERRAQINLENAIKRGDTKAIANINRKIEIYQFTIGLLEKIPIK